MHIKLILLHDRLKGKIDQVGVAERAVEHPVVEVVLPLHKAQLRSYLKLANRRLGLLVNFNVERLKDGIHRIVNGEAIYDTQF